jgi:hypothetical protein
MSKRILKHGARPLETVWALALEGTTMGYTATRQLLLAPSEATTANEEWTSVHGLSNYGNADLKAFSKLD